MCDFRNGAVVVGGWNEGGCAVGINDGEVAFARDAVGGPRVKVPDSPSMEKEEMERAPTPVGFGRSVSEKIAVESGVLVRCDGFTGVAEGVINGVDGDVQSERFGGARRHRRRCM